MWLGRVLPPEEALVSGLQEGTIELEPGWNLIAVPAVYGRWDGSTVVHDGSRAKIKEYVVDQLESLYGAGIVAVANSYPGDLGYFLSFVPGSTPASSEHNFYLMREDPLGQWEPQGFWIKITGTQPVQFQWKGYME